MKNINFNWILILTIILIFVFPITSMAFEKDIGYPLPDSKINEFVNEDSSNMNNDDITETECQMDNFSELELYSTTASGYVDGYKYRKVDHIDASHFSSVYRWGRVSPVQQFLYKDQGLAYAYTSENKLHIVTPKSEFVTDMKYPRLGDVISDDNGNFYVVWGKSNEENTYNTQTVFISKFSDTGIHIKTTGFVGTSVMGTTGNTKIPFDAGGCDSVISNGYLMVNYARTMYNGHQSNNVIGVKIDDMSAIWANPYTSHSFNQKVIWSNLADSFVYADHGDAYGRGFIITVGNTEKNIFHFYLQANANYDMYIVNETFAQLGGLDENSKGAILCGASVKSIGENAKNEKQNLFVQIFDPTEKKISESMFVGGEERIGETSFDINDNNNSPLTPVTDYGIHWLTDYTEKNVIAPQMVVCDDKIVLLWTTDEIYDSSYYMILSNSGDVLVPATKLRGILLNSYEKPVCFNEDIYWAYSCDKTIGVVSLEEILKGDVDGPIQEETLKINSDFYSTLPCKVDGTYSPIDSKIITEAEYLEIQSKALELTKNCVSDAEKVKVIHDWIAENIYYNYDYINSGKNDSGVSNPYEVYRTGTAISSGYAKLYLVMLDSVGVKSIIVRGQVGISNIASNYGRMDEWNLVYLDNKWIAIDIAWNSSNRYVNGKKYYYGYNYECYDADDKVFAREHRCKEVSYETGIWVEGICYKISNSKPYIVTVDKSIENTSILNGVERIEWGTFKDCEKLISIEIPSSVKTIGSQAFNNCKSLQKIKLPYGIAEIESWTFAGCSSLKKIDIPYSVSRIGDTAFYNCSSLTSITIPYKVETIGDWTFAGCSRLESIELPSTIKELGQYAFGWCYSLKEAVIPKNLEYCHDEAFLYDKIKIVGFGDLSEEIANANGFMYTELPEIITYAGLSYNLAENQLISVPDVTSASVPSKVNGITIWSINERALDECNKIQKLRMPKTIIDIEAGTFDNCDNVILSVHEDSFAYQYAIENNILYEMIQAIIGDVFCDESVNSKDSIKLSQYLAKWSVDLTSDEMISADIVTDGLINSKDSIKLAQYLAKWNVSLE